MKHSSAFPLAILPFVILRAAGEARSRGLEFDLSGELTRTFSLIASYAYTDARFTQDDSGLQGHRIANVPRHSGSLWAKAQLVPERLSAGVGAFVRSQREGDNENTFQMPGYATLDAFAAWTSRVGSTRMVAQLNVSNLLNKRYFINSNVYDASPRFGVMPGQPRTLIGSVRFEI
jgi:iron complex outermembrane receptor protein